MPNKIAMTTEHPVAIVCALKQKGFQWQMAKIKYDNALSTMKLEEAEKVKIMQRKN